MSALTHLSSCGEGRGGGNRLRAIVALAAATLMLAWPAAVSAATPSFGSGSDTDLARMLSDVGFRGDRLITALEVMFAESGGDPRALNPSGARGIFQFMPNTLADDSCAYDPVCASQMTFQVTAGGADWRRWEAFTSGAYQRFSARAHAAVRLAAIDAAAPQLVNQPQFGLPTLDPQKLIYQTIAGMLYGADQFLIGEMEKLWNPMVTGTDDLNGSTSFGSVVVVDNSKLRNIWGISFSVATGALLVLLFTLSVVMWMVQEGVGARHDLVRNLLYFFLAVILMGSSFFLISQLLVLDNALVSAVNNQAVIELRSLPAYQGLGLKDPSSMQEAKQLLDVIVLFLVGLFIGVELIVLFFIYFLRIVLIWALVVLAPFVLAASILPGARGIAIYWARLLCVTVFFKFVNVLVFLTFVLMGAAAQVAVFNLLIVGTMLLFMILVPTTLLRAMSEPHLAAAAFQQGWTTTTRYAPLRLAGSQLRARLAQR